MKTGYFIGRSYGFLKPLLIASHFGPSNSMDECAFQGGVYLELTLHMRLSYEFEEIDVLPTSALSPTTYKGGFHALETILHAGKINWYR